MIQLDIISGHDALSGTFRRFPVYPDPAGKNEFVGPAARAHAGIGQSLVQSDAFRHSPVLLMRDECPSRKKVAVLHWHIGIM